MKKFTRCATGGLLSLLFAVATALPAAAQGPAAGTGALTGTVLDSASRQPVAYATVVLLPPAPNEKPITGVAADDQGKFSFTKLAAGPFRLRASYVGYGTHTRAVVVDTGPLDVGALRLRATAQALGEAVIIGSKPVVEVRPDRLVYNAEQDVSNAGGTAQDVLRKAPLLAVDGDGNVTMRGSANFKVLVNNKPSPTLARNLAEALKSIPAEQIQSVEVITTPPAKYDGEGTAGIINIVLKKGTKQGANGRLGLSGGNRNNNFNSALNFRQGKINFTSSANAGTWYSPGASEIYRLGYSAAGTDTLRRNGTNYSRGGWTYGTVGLDYDPAEHHSITLASSINYYSGKGIRDLFNRYDSPLPAANQLFSRATTEVFNGLNVEGTATYTRTFAQARKEWSVLGQYALNTGTFGYDYDQFQGSSVLLSSAEASYRERSRGRTPGQEVTLQTDYTQPLGEQSKLEVGLKGIFRSTGSVATVDTLRTNYGPALAKDPRRSTDFSYRQDVQAAYGIYSFGVGKKLSASLGSRLERTSVNADFRTTNSQFAPSYFTVLPNGFAQYKLNEASSMRAAYSRRITRPAIDFLNPFRDASAPGFVSFGNPFLSPELTDSYELSYNTTVKITTLNAALSVRHTGNAIESVNLLSDTLGVVETTYRNVAANTFYQFNVFASLKPNPKWDLSLGPDVQYVVRRSPSLQADQRGFTASLNLNTSYRLPKEYTVQAFAYGSLRTIDIQGYGPANLYYSFGGKKTFWNKKADVALNIASPFNGRWPYRSTLSTPAFDQRSTFYAYQRSFRLSLAYRFGQEQQGKQRKSINNDDTKGGGSKQGG
ncbi:outer membrane beta-barrel family protein [Hymenobacter nivis]|uniref:TonB-dependent receptor n=1 Tax=Hymenobacter nivis TaxID=1850093 RepID=A0A502HFS5_9BACT|nr:outer membrane beta-barrel family protein [Hymenobacter nivis]TPG72465.1 TonB-dependent receptor [Hymenobacter nivis]